MSASTNQPATIAPAGDARPGQPVVPIWLIIVLFMLAYWGAVYFDEHGAWFDKQVYAPFASAEQLKDYQVGGGASIFDVGEKIYNRPTCVACHMGNGLGQAGQFPPLAGSDWVNEKEPGRMIRIVLQGFTGPGLVVKGAPFNTGGTMTPFNYLSDEEIAAVITYVRGNTDWGNHAPPVTPEQVKAVREKVKQTHPQLYYSPAEIGQVNPAD